MSNRVLFSVAAERDMRDLLDYLAPRAGVPVARAYVDRLIAFCASLATFPKRGKSRDDISVGLRLVGYRRKATIIFRVRDNVVIILRVYHGGKNVNVEDFIDT